MHAPLGGLDVETFLREYWQQKPLLVRQAMPGFVPQLDGDDLAGLACEPMAESRIVSGSFPAHDWDLRHGPFEESDFAGLPETNWTLLVQDVEKHYPPLLELMARFDFLPGWRLDDLMISWAAPGGSVGPHVDQYDVFLLQAEGRRRWQIAERFDPDLLEGCALNVLQRFEPEREWLLEPGDMLYLPPGVAHFGVAETAGMTWSVGLRAPDAADLLTALGEHLAESGGAVPRYRDPGLHAPRRPGEIDPAALDALRALMAEPLNDPVRFRRFAGEFLTRFRLAQQPAPPEAEIEAGELLERLSSGGALWRNPWTRLAWVAGARGAHLFAAGDRFSCSTALAQALCAGHQPEVSDLGLDARDLAALTALVNAGHLVLMER